VVVASVLLLLLVVAVLPWQDPQVVRFAHNSCCFLSWVVVLIKGADWFV
jgi:hypothetical protein